MLPARYYPMYWIPCSEPPSITIAAHPKRLPLKELSLPTETDIMSRVPPEAFTPAVRLEVLAVRVAEVGRPFDG
jgi:hypothetical protein